MEKAIVNYPVVLDADEQEALRCFCSDGEPVRVASHNGEVFAWNPRPGESPNRIPERAASISPPARTHAKAERAAADETNEELCSPIVASESFEIASDTTKARVLFAEANGASAEALLDELPDLLRKLYAEKP